MVCSQERTDKKYPFDIQHRTVIPYVADAPSDFDALKQSLTARIKAVLTKGEALRQIAETEQISPIHGLSQPELFVLAELSSSLYMPDSFVASYQVKNDVEKAGLTALGFSLGVRRLVSKEFIEIVETVNFNDETYSAFRLLEKGWQWIEANEKLFKVHKRNPASDDILTDEDVPF
jgi:hypothetical protein